MIKKFVPLDGDIGPTHTIYNVKTYKGADIPKPVYANPCSSAQLPKPCVPGRVPGPPKPVTIEEAIFRWFDTPTPPVQKSANYARCQYVEPYTACVLPRRTPTALKTHAVFREKYLKEQTDFVQKVHDGQDEPSEGASLIEMDSLELDEGEEGDGKPKMASPACSRETYFVPSKRLLEVNRLKSGVFVNETPISPIEIDIPFETYNPRNLQKKLEAEGRQKYKLFSDGERFYFPWMPDQEEMGEPNDNNKPRSSYKPVIFPIPNDLEKTFRANVVFGNGAIPPHEPTLRTSTPVEVACLYAAYIESFFKNPDYWNTERIDSIVQSGMGLYQKSVERKYESPTIDFDIIPELTERSSTVEIKFHTTACLTGDPNVLKSLTIFFDKALAGILSVQNLYVLIWKRCMDSFYIFDPNGRDLNCQRNVIEGKASLIAIQTIEHIVHLILNYSDIDNDADFNLYEIIIKDFGKIVKPMELPPPRLIKKRFAIVNKFYSIIPALSGLATDYSGRAQDSNPSLMTSYLVLVYSQIDSPRQWTVQIVDDLIKFGKKYHSDFMCDYKLTSLHVTDLPPVLLFGNYRVIVEKITFYASGPVVECRSYRSSQLTLAIRNFFSAHTFGLIQIDHSTFACWREGCMFFVFDPFKRGPAGQAGSFSKHGVGCLQLHINIDSLCRMMFINSIEIKTEGSFFIHAIRVKAVGTFNINRALKDSTGFGTLRIKYPFDCEAPVETDEDGGAAVEKKPDLEDNTIARSLVECLSDLSVSPCERTCSERDFVHQQKKLAYLKSPPKKRSIESIPEEYLIPEFDAVDVVEAFIEEFLDELMERIKRRTEKRERTCIEASKILLQTDKKYLQELKRRLKRGEDYDNICTAFQSKPSVLPKLTLEEELAMASSFKTLPDGSWAVFGQQTDIQIPNGSLRGILSTIMAAALTIKYKISTWNSSVIDFAYDSASVLEERFLTYNHTLDLIFRRQIPKIQVGSTICKVHVIGTKSIEWDKLKLDIEKTLLKTTKLLLICRGFTCLIVRRYNFTYMFMGCSCDIVGFRSQSTGPIALLRFIEMNALVRRIEQACGPCQKYVLVEIEVKTILGDETRQFLPRTESDDELMYKQKLSEKEQQKRRYKEKMKFLESQLRKEDRRLQRFQKMKEEPDRRKIKDEPPSPSTSDFPTEGEEMMESEGSVEYKHTPRENASQKTMEAQRQQQFSPQRGYQLRDKDCLFKIQGSIAMENRSAESPGKIKPCFFASSVAILYAILRPINHWDSLRIDRVITIAMRMAKQTRKLEENTVRTLKNIDVDEFIFEIKAFWYEPPGTYGGHEDLGFYLNKALQKQKYILVQFSNVTFTVYKDRFYHLFDPYKSMELADDAEEMENEDDQPKFPEDIPKSPEQDTASWVLFGNIPTMLEYIGKRVASRNWKTDFKLHAICIVSHKTAPNKNVLFNLLTDDICPTAKALEKDNLCTHPEEIEWLDIYPNLVSWSRLNRSNAAKRIRGTPATKEKNFDIEIPNKLYSLWGSIHPLSSVFGSARNKQHLAIDVAACCIAGVYRVADWNPQVIDSIVISGHDYYQMSVMEIKRKDYEISLEHLNTSLDVGELHFDVHLENVLYGTLYARGRDELNLGAALGYFFTYNDYGIIQCMKRSIAIGKTDLGYFMFECQSHGLPLFPEGQGAAYVLHTTQLQILLYCVVLTLNNTFFNSQFTIHKVEIITEDQGEGEEIEDEDVTGEDGSGKRKPKAKPKPKKKGKKPTKKR